MEAITSAQNPKLKRLALLQRSSAERRSSGLMVVEGLREVRRCLEAGFSARALFCCPEIAGNRTLEDLSALCPEARCFSLSPAAYARVAYREGTEGILAEVSVRERSLEMLSLPEDALVIVLEGVEKPGNLGAVLRSADGAGADAVLVCDPQTDLWNPNLIRASLGTVFSVPAVACRSEEAIAFLRARRIRILTAQLQDSSLYYACDMRKATAIVMGTESTGLTPQWREAADAHILIPMLGRADSLNVSVSAAILLYEAVRQRQVSKQ